MVRLAREKTAAVLTTNAAEVLDAGVTTASSLSTSFVFGLAYVLFACKVLYFLFGLAVDVLFAFPGMGVAARNVAVQIAVLIGTNLHVSTVTVYCLFAPERTSMVLMLVVHVLCDGVSAAYFYFAFDDVLGMLIWVALACIALTLLCVHKYFYDLVARLPIERHTISMMLDVFRIYIIVIMPIITTMLINDGTASLVPYYTTITFSVSSGMVLCFYRVLHAAIPDARGTTSLLMHLSMSQIAKVLAGAVVMMLAFIVLFLINVSQRYVPTWVLGLLLALWAVGAVITLTIFLCSLINIRFASCLTEEQYQRLKGIQALAAVQDGDDLEMS